MPPGRRKSPIRGKATSYPTKRGKNGKKVGKVRIRRWKDGGELRVGKTVVDMLEGKIDPKDWTMEELIRGAPMHVRRLPNVIPLNVYQEIIRRTVGKGKVEFAKDIQKVVKIHLEIIRNIKTKKPTAAQLKSIDMFYNIVGMYEPQEHVLYDGGEAPWMRLMATSIVSTDDDDEIIEGEVIEGAVSTDAQTGTDG